MIDKYTRIAKDLLLNSVVRLFARLGITPLKVTVLGFIAGTAAAAAAAFGYWTAALLLWFFNRILDGIDGSLARKTGTVQEYGAYLDIMLDFVVYAALPIGIALGVSDMLIGEFLWQSVSLLLAAYYINSASWMYISAIQEKRSMMPETPTSIAMPAGIIEGTETILFYTLALIFTEYAVIIFFIFALLVLLTAVVRAAWWIRNELIMLNLPS